MQYNTLYNTVSLFRYVCVALNVTEKLLSDCDARRLPLIADSYLDMLHVMLESTNTNMQIMATNSVSGFCVCYNT